jgi:hypothetical protein
LSAKPRRRQLRLLGVFRLGDVRFRGSLGVGDSHLRRTVRPNLRVRRDDLVGVVLHVSVERRTENLPLFNYHTVQPTLGTAW